MKLVHYVEQEIPYAFLHSASMDREKIKSCLDSMREYSITFTSILKTWLENFFNAAIKPKMRPIMSSLSIDLSYNIDESQSEELVLRQTFLKRFQKSFTGLVAPYMTTLTTRNSNALTGFMVDHFAKEWERILMGMQVNLMGAARLEADVRGVNSILVANQWSTRDKMTRMSQIALLLNLQSVQEILEYWGMNSGPIVWRITATQAKKVMMLRVDFDKREIEDLAL